MAVAAVPRAVVRLSVTEALCFHLVGPEQHSAASTSRAASLGALTREFRADLLASSVNSIRNFASNRVQAKRRLQRPKA
jgi:hypothetical protein